MNFRRIIFGLGVIALWCGCDVKPKSDAARNQPGSPVVARVGDFEITTADLQAEWARRHAATGTVLSADAATVLLEALIREKTLLLRAQAAGWEQQPETRRLIEQLIVSRFLATELARRDTNAALPTAAELQAFYDGQPNRFGQPAAWRAGVIWLRHSPKAEAAQRAAQRERAVQLLQQVTQADAAAFPALVQQHSDHQATRYQGGDTAWWSVGQPALFEAEVLSAITNLPAVGAVSPLVETPTGFYIVRLLEQRPARRQPLAEVREQLEYEWQQQSRQQREAAFFAEMAQGVPMQLDRTALRQFFPTNQTTAATQPKLPGS